MQQAAEMATTDMNAPYDLTLLRPLRCAGRRDGRDCGERNGTIDWNAPIPLKTWQCKKCGTVNALRILEARPRDR